MSGHRAPGAQPVAAEDAEDLIIREPDVDQSAREVRQSADFDHVARRKAAVVVGSEAEVLGTDERRRVREEPRQVKRAVVGLPQLAPGGEEDAHDAALCGERLDLLVAEVAAGRVIVKVLDERAAARVRADHRRRGGVERVVERLLGRVRDVDEDAERVHLAHGLAAECGQARARILPVALRDFVAPHPRQPDRADAQLVEDVQKVEVALERFRALDREDQRDLALAMGAHDVIGRGCAHRQVRRRVQIGDALPVRFQREGQERPAARPRHEDVRDLPRQTTLQRPREVPLACRGTLPQSARPRRRVAVRVVAHVAVHRRAQAVVVEVDHGRLPVQAPDVRAPLGRHFGRG